MPGDEASDVEHAQQLERAAQELLDGGGGGDQIVLALDQLRADRANGEPLASAVRGLGEAMDAATGSGPTESETETGED